MDSFTGNGSNQATSNNNNQQKEDYLDKGLDAVEKKYGGASTEDTQRYRSVNEKITDGARNMFEKATGKDVPDKFSN
ncbi:hypothetical protein COCVIDRAFT_30751 [Bipolaris victoriae FI3]|uniref:Uncharacterized protein n=1 Tax=Bipolaris victoriae (strain FI3) TaxID=930091 RepID=W7E8D2_BIPV3|nr:hypothetical protein COCVIDRAFT_30751 [Bipolaris victoriae FI3]